MVGEDELIDDRADGSGHGIMSIEQQWAPLHGGPEAELCIW